MRIILSGTCELLSHRKKAYANRRVIGIRFTEQTFPSIELVKKRGKQDKDDEENKNRDNDARNHDDEKPFPG